MAHRDPVLAALCRDLAPWEQVVLVAGRQGRAIHVRQLVDCELTRRMRRSAQDRGHLHRYHRGVRAVGVPQLSAVGRRWAAYLAAGSDTAFTRDTGAALSGLRPAGRIIHVAAPKARRNHYEVRVHALEGLNPAWIRRRDGLPVLKPAYLFLDLAVGLRPDALSIALSQALALRVVRLDGLEAAVDERATHPGRRALLAAIAAERDDPGDGRTHGELEALVLPLLRTLPGLPPFRRNELVELGGGRLAKADVLFAGLGVMLELDSRTWHEQRLAMDSDRRRDQQALAAGVLTFRVTWRHATREWEVVSADLLATLARRAVELPAGGEPAA